MHHSFISEGRPLPHDLVVLLHELIGSGSEGRRTLARAVRLASLAELELRQLIVRDGPRVLLVDTESTGYAVLDTLVSRLRWKGGRLPILEIARTDHARPEPVDSVDIVIQDLVTRGVLDRDYFRSGAARTVLRDVTDQLVLVNEIVSVLDANRPVSARASARVAVLGLIDMLPSVLGSPLDEQQRRRAEQAVHQWPFGTVLARARGTDLPAAELIGA